MSEREREFEKISEKFKEENPEIAKALNLLNISLTEYYTSLSYLPMGMSSADDSSEETV